MMIWRMPPEESGQLPENSYFTFRVADVTMAQTDGIPNPFGNCTGKAYEHAHRRGGGRGDGGEAG